MTLPFEKLVTEDTNERTANLDTMLTIELVRAMNEEDKTVALAIERVLPQVAEAIDIIVDTIRAGGRLIYVGAGTSGRLGVLDASECPPTFGISSDMVRGIVAGGSQALVHSSEGSEDDRDAGRVEIRSQGVRASDVVVALTASGRTPYAIAALETARELGARVIAVTCNANSPIEQVAELTIAPVVGPEVIAGSTRLKAGTAQKMVLNMLSTGAMVHLGKVFRNLMVDVQPTNDKLVERAKSIIMQATGIDYDAAGRVLEQANRQVKVAVVMSLSGTDAQQAREALTRVGGFVGKAVSLICGQQGTAGA